MKNRLIIASNRLPVTVMMEQGNTLRLERSNGGLATALNSLLDSCSSLWIGWPGTTEPISHQELTRMNGDKRLLPVHVPAKLLSGYYNGFANNVLWPALHGFDPAAKPAASDWKAYEAVNKRFAEQIKHNCRSGDTIWIHDFHLLLVPKMLRAMGVGNRIGFFLHTPFASPDCLKAVPHYKELLESLAQTDVVGMQTDSNITNFAASLKEADITRRSGMLLKAFPIGINYDLHQNALQKPAAKRELAKAMAVAAGRRVILSISRLDYTKGIPQQLEAYEHLLAKQANPEGLFYKLIVAPSRKEAAGYKELQIKIEKLVTRINNRFKRRSGQPPINYTYRNCGFDEVSAWYSLADVLLVTPRIDGMNLVVKEYIATKRTSGALVMSNTIGAAQQLAHALLVNPHDVPAIAHQLERALKMSSQELGRRWSALHDNVKKQDVFWWLDSFMEALRLQPHATAPLYELSGKA
jgi:trehalose 6-phosphate synthase/phosphatase